MPRPCIHDGQPPLTRHCKVCYRYSTDREYRLECGGPEELEQPKFNLVKRSKRALSRMFGVVGDTLDNNECTTDRPSRSSWSDGVSLVNACFASGSGSAPAVEIPCCDGVFLPAALCVVLSNPTGLWAQFTYDLAFQITNIPGTAIWHGTIDTDVPGVTVSAELVCDSSTLTFYGSVGIAGSGVPFCVRAALGNQALSNVVTTCDPFLYSATSTTTGGTAAYECVDFVTTSYPDTSIDFVITADQACVGAPVEPCCCDDPVAANLCLTLSGCTCIDGDEILLMYDTATSDEETIWQWSASGITCGAHTIEIFLKCEKDGEDCLGWTMRIACDASEDTSTDYTQACGPFELVFTFGGVNAIPDCCDAAITVTVVESDGSCGGAGGSCPDGTVDDALCCYGECREAGPLTITFLDDLADPSVCGTIGPAFPVTLAAYPDWTGSGVGTPNSQYRLFCNDPGLPSFEFLLEHTTSGGCGICYLPMTVVSCYPLELSWDPADGGECCCEFLPAFVITA